MNALVAKAIAEIAKLSDGDQEAIARELLARLGADARWDDLFADPRSEALLERLVEEAAEDERQGRVFDRDPADQA